MSKLPSILIVDASILFSFFKADSGRREILEKLSLKGCRLITPGFAFEELMNDKERIKEHAGLSEAGFEFVFSLLERKIETFSEDEYEEFLSDANKISPHGEGTDPKSTKDDPYFALALSLNCPIWSDDTGFEQQTKVKVFGTERLSKLSSNNEPE